MPQLALRSAGAVQLRQALALRLCHAAINAYATEKRPLVIRICHLFPTSIGTTVCLPRSR